MIGEDREWKGDRAIRGGLMNDAGMMVVAGSIGGGDLLGEDGRG